MTGLDIIICASVISVCATVGICALIWHEFDKRYKEDVGRLNAKVCMLEEMIFNMKEYYSEHMKKYH